jgi:hypothetical protein
VAELAAASAARPFNANFVAQSAWSQSVQSFRPACLAAVQVISIAWPNTILSAIPTVLEAVNVTVLKRLATVVLRAGK